MTIPKHLLESKIITDEQWKEYQELKEYKKNATRKHWQQKSAEHYAKEVIYKSRIDKAIEYIKTSMNNPQPFYEYIYGDENEKIENLDKLLNELQGEDNE